jgi:hypothetical protein
MGVSIVSDVDFGDKLDTCSFVACSIKERCFFSLRCEVGHSTSSSIFSDVVRYELPMKFFDIPRSGYGVNGPRVYIFGDNDNVRISVGDSFRGLYRNLVYPPRPVDWEVVLFDGSIADPAFDLDVIVKRINLVLFKEAVWNGPLPVMCFVGVFFVVGSSAILW